MATSPAPATQTQPEPTAAAKVRPRRPLPFVIPAEMSEHPTFGPVTKALVDLIGKREAHVSIGEDALLAARDAQVKQLGAGHPSVTALNDVIQASGAAWV